MNSFKSLVKSLKNQTQKSKPKINSLERRRMEFLESMKPTKEEAKQLLEEIRKEQSEQREFRNRSISTNQNRKSGGRKKSFSKSQKKNKLHRTNKRSK